MFRKKARNPTEKSFKILKTAISEFSYMTFKTLNLIKSNMNELNISQEKFLDQTQQKKIEENNFISSQIVSPLLVQLENLLTFFTEKTSSLLETNKEKKSKLDILISKVSSQLKHNVEKFDIELAQARRDAEKVIFSKNQGISFAYIGNYKEEGDDVKVVKHGKGTLTNGLELYKGQFVNGMKHGFGIQVFEEGVSFKGIWESNQPKYGIWKQNGNFFYGVVDREMNWKLGEVVKDQLGYMANVNKFGKFGYELFYNERPTGLKRLKLDQYININALKKKKKGERNEATVEFVNNISYTGEWFNFKPQGLGKINITKEKKPEIFQTISYRGDILIYKNYEVIKDDSLLTDSCCVKITFVDGSYYKGYIEENIRFIGDGTLYIKETEEGGDLKIRCIFSNLDGLIFNLDENNEQIPLDYLRDTESYISLEGVNRNLIEVKLNEFTSFEGYWNHFYPDLYHKYTLMINGAVYTNHKKFMVENSFRNSAVKNFSQDENAYEFLNEEK